MKRTPLELSQRALRFGAGFAEIGGLQKDFLLGSSWIIMTMMKMILLMMYLMLTMMMIMRMMSEIMLMYHMALMMMMITTSMYMMTMHVTILLDTVGLEILELIIINGGCEVLTIQILLAIGFQNN